MTKLIAFTFFLLSIQLSHANCSSNADLKSIGFIISSRDFNSQFNKVDQWLENDQDSFIEDLSGTIYSRSARTHVAVTSFDHTQTPQSKMYGDIVFIVDHWDNTPIEVRWYKNGKKYISYNSKIQKCATSVVPIAVNALF